MIIDQIENRMVVDSEWPDCERNNNIPICECCEEKNMQLKALHILHGKERVWLCDRCIEDMKEVTGYDGAD